MKNKRHFSFPLILAVLFFSTGCDDHTLKRPKENQSTPASGASQKPSGVDKAFARELAREFGREFGREFAKELTARGGISAFDANASNLPQEVAPAPVSPGGLVDEFGKPHPLLAHCAEDVLEFYLKHPDAFSIATPDGVPSDLVWENGSGEAEFSSPKAKRGGTWNVFMGDFPRTLRVIGPDANGAFRSYLLDYNVLSLVMPHPDSVGYYPGLADSWAVGEDSRTVYFRLDPNARYSDGNPVRVSDFFFHFYFMRSKYIQAPWYNDFYGKDKFLNLTLYDERTLSITFYKAKPDVVERVSIRAIPEHFYEELDGEFLRQYQWKPEPTTGPYVALPENVDKGKSVTLVRLDDWWANDKKFYRHRFNPDRIHVTVIRDYNKAFETFLKGDLDMFGLAKTEFWYEKLPNDDPLVTKGYLTKLTFFNQIPPPTYAMRINSQKPPLDDLNLRVGLHHAMNFELVLEKIFRGDFQRMNTVADGYGLPSHPTLRAREFSVEKAIVAFAKAGFVQRGPDGILRNGAGERLAVTVTTGYKHYEDVLTVLKEEAKKAGVELNLELLERTAAWKKAGEKNHQIVFSAFNSFVELFPRFWEPYHSDNAYEEEGDSKYNEDGSLKPNLITKTSTNNFTQTAVRRMDHLIDAYRVEEDLGKITQMAHQLSSMVHEHAVYVPAWKKPWLRMGHWNWIKFPEDWGPRESRDYEEFQVFWIDQEKNVEISEALKTGKPVSDKPTVRVYDKFRTE